jgi:hypothetical protein
MSNRTHTFDVMLQVVGLAAAIGTWLYVASANDLNGEISIASTGGQYPLLFGASLPGSRGAVGMRYCELHHNRPNSD